MITSYDRRATPVLIEALSPGGFAHSLVEYGSSGMYGLDLQLRGVAKGRKWATLYVGTTKALDLEVTQAGKFRLKTHASHATDASLRWVEAWSTLHTPEWFAAEWGSVEAYLDRVISSVSRNGKHLQEGVVQSAVSRYSGNGFAMVDREAVVSYANQAVKTRQLKAINGPWLSAVKRTDGPTWWAGAAPAKSSTECDLLAVSDDGQLTAIEIKPSSATPSAIAFSPIQARQYADQFQAWLDEHGSDGTATLTELMKQQQAIGMRSPGELPRIDAGLRVKPVVVIDSRVSKTARARLVEVVKYLRSRGSDPEVEVRYCNLIGRLHEPERI
jgi:hypothetical protein